MAIDLSDESQLKTACEHVTQQVLVKQGNQKWVSELLAAMQRVHDVSHKEFVSEAFQRFLWNTQAVSSTGMGSVEISEVAKSPSVAESLWRLKEQYPSLDPAQQDALIAETWTSVEREAVSLAKRNPKLKMYRVFALLCPGAFTTIAHFRKLKELAGEMGIRLRGESGPALHRMVLDRLEAVLGDPEDVFTKKGVERLTLPWLLFVEYVQNPEVEATEKADPDTGEEKLNPLPPERRRRGMLAIGGGQATVLTMIEFAREGCSREDFIQHLQSISPKSKRASLNTQLNALIAEWGVVRAQGSELYLTPRGEAFLDSGDQDEVIDWMVTRILGFDNMLHALKQAPMASSQAVLLLRKVNPGWTSDFAPFNLLGWLRYLQLVEMASGKLLRLTERGEQWVNRIHWTPGLLAGATAPDESVEQAPATMTGFERAERQPLQQIIEGFDAQFKFSDELIGQLDAGLWSHPRRHFAVLTGLSGAGKTQLARGYALSLWQGEEHPHDGLLIVPVQPGWHDPSSVLGYVNPLDNDVYVRTGVLDFLLRASGDRSRPYTLVLDEMNLSHPEQYLAPLLSAMETGDDLELHAQGDDVSDVPSVIPYPDNLVIIGTVNMDETTHGLSDKVLDRASVIEFWNIDVDAFPGWVSSTLASGQTEQVRQITKDLMSALRPVRLHFGWRTL
nr:hypothetical protein [Pseudomonas sp.]